MLGRDAHPSHLVRNLSELGSSSKFNAEWEFLTMLRDKGRESADAFLTAHGRDLGRQSSVDIDKLLDEVVVDEMPRKTA
jgi:hypothetical protein